MGAVRLLQFRRLRHQPLRALIACISVAAGVALGVSIVVVITSVNRSYDEFGTGVAGRATLRVVGATSIGGLDEKVLPKIERVEGVASAVPFVQAVTVAQRSPGDRLPVLVIGVDCRAEAIFGALGCDPAALARARDTDPPLVSPAVLRDAGAGATLRTSGSRLPLLNAITVPQLGALGGGRVAVFPLPVAQRLFARVGQLDAIYIVPKPGVTVDALAARLQTVAGPWNGVLRAAAPPPVAKLVLNTFVPLFMILAILGLGIGAVLVYNTVSLSMEERRLQLAIVSALGGTHRVLLGGALVEAGAIGLVGGLLGVPAGFVLARPIVESLRTFTETVIALPIRVHFTLAPVIWGALLGVVLAIVAAWIAARRALRIDVSAELSNRERRAEAASRRLLRRAVVTLALALVGMGMCEVASRGGALESWQPPLALIGVGLTTLAFTLTLGAWVPLVIRSILRARAAAAAPASAQLALANIIREPNRTGVMAVAIGSAVGVAFIVASYNASISQGISDNITRGAGRSLRIAVIPPTNNINVEGRLSAQVLNGLRKVPGVARVDRSATVMTGTTANDIVGVSAFEHPTMPLLLLAGTKDRGRLERGEVMIGAGLARRRGLRPGDRVRLPTSTGFVTAPVQGVWLDGDFNGNSVNVPLHMMEKVWGVRAPQQVFVQPSPGVGGETLRSRILAANLDPDLQVHTGPRLTKLVVDDVKRSLDAFWAAQRALVIVAFVAVLSTLLLVGVQRRRELATLVAVGMESRQLARLVMLEAGVVAVVAAVLSTVGAVGMFEATRQVLPIFIGFHDPFRLDFGALLLYAPLTIAVVLLASALPAWRASRLEVVPALQYE